jgi:hypothetical protein
MLDQAQAGPAGGQHRPVQRRRVQPVQGAEDVRALPLQVRQQGCGRRIHVVSHSRALMLAKLQAAGRRRIHRHRSLSAAEGPPPAGAGRSHMAGMSKMARRRAGADRTLARQDGPPGQQRRGT